MGNIKTIISNHNKAQINKSTRTNDQTKNCNCRKSTACPMDGNCSMESVIYQAEVTTPNTKETYIGLCDTTFKLRYRNHVCSFRNERYKHATELSKYIWKALRNATETTTHPSGTPTNEMRLNCQSTFGS